MEYEKTAFHAGDFSSPFFMTDYSFLHPSSDPTRPVAPSDLSDLSDLSALSDLSDL